jgi:histidinol dehydrogenase
MAMALDMQSADFEPRFAALIAAKREASADVDLAVADIIADVRGRGDEALAEYSLRSTASTSRGSGQGSAPPRSRRRPQPARKPRSRR